MVFEEEEKISDKLDENIRFFNTELGVDTNFDILYRVVSFAGKTAVFYFIDGFFKDEMLEKLMEHFYKIKEEDMPKSAYELLKQNIPYMEIELLDNKKMILETILAGIPCIFVDGFEHAITMDCRTYPARGIEEPEKDKVMRGSRDGFAETLVTNTALIRRRIRSTQLRMEITTVGESSRTDLVLCYMMDRVDQQMLKKLKEKIEATKVDALTMNQESLAECLQRGSYLNPFPKYKYSERPDTTSASILEGSIAIILDNSPAAMILPTSLFDIVQEADDYYFPPITGTYLRLSRYVINIISVFLTPLFLLLINNPEWIPAKFDFIKLKETVNVPLVWQFLILEFALDGLRLAAINTPSMLSTPLSVAAGLIIGDFTVSSGWFNAEAMLYEAFVAIATYTQASYELGYALKLMRIFTLILTSWFQLWGFIGGIIITFGMLLLTKTITGRDYLYPLIPFNGRKLARCYVRQPLEKERKNRRNI